MRCLYRDEVVIIGQASLLRILLVAHQDEVVVLNVRQILIDGHLIPILMLAATTRRDYSRPLHTIGEV